MLIQCPSCGIRANIKAVAGDQVQCPSCHTSFEATAVEIYVNKAARWLNGGLIPRSKELKEVSPLTPCNPKGIILIIKAFAILTLIVGLSIGIIGGIAMSIQRGIQMESLLFMLCYCFGSVVSFAFIFAFAQILAMLNNIQHHTNKS